MKKVSRYLAVTIPTLIILVIAVILFLTLQNSGKRINPMALSEKFHLVISADNPLELSNIAGEYSNLEGLFPATEIASYQPLLKDIHKKEATENHVAWIFTDDSIASSAMLIPVSEVTLPVKKDALSKFKSDSETIVVQKDQIKWSVKTVDHYYLISKDNFTLNFISGILNQTGQWHKYGHVCSGTQIFVSGTIPGIIETEGDTVFQFDVVQYQDKLYFNALKAREESMSSGISAAIPSSGDLSLPQPFPGNSRCLIRKSEGKDERLQALELSKGGSNTIAQAFRSTNISSEKNHFAALEQPVAKGPFSVDNHQTGEKNIIVFDVSNQMYLFDLKGNLIWKKRFRDKILGNIYQVDKYNNGKYQYLWNSTDNIHLIDITGNEVEGFPFSVPGKISGGVSIIHFKGYTYPNILLIDNSKKLVNINLTPAIVPEWKTQTVNFTVTEPIQYLYQNSEHYVVVAGDNGEVIMVDKTGDIRMRIKNSFTNNPNSKFYFNETNSKGNLITTDNYGNLIYIPKFGNVKKTVFGTYSQAHYFFYEDYDFDGNKDFFFMDDKKISVFNRFKRIVFEATTLATISIKPLIIRNNGKTRIGVVNPQTSLLELYEKTGMSDIKIPCSGEYLYDSGSNTIFSVQDKKLYSTKLN